MNTHVLFVDDDPSVLSMLKRVLRERESEWEMHFAESAAAALCAIETIAFDTIVLDVLMPRMDGFGLLLELRQHERTRHIPVVILTCLKESDLKRRALDLGANDLLTKPIDVPELVARIRSMLRLRRQEKLLAELNSDLEEKVRERTATLESSRQEIILRLSKAAEYRENLTGNHNIRVASYCRVLSEQLELGKRFTDMLFLTSPLHDIGKIGIPDSVLLNEGELTPEERRLMEKHCAVGAAILLHYPKGLKPLLATGGADMLFGESGKENPVLQTAASIALCHHERWDGSGYPRQLRGNAIPLESRMLAVADTFDAITSARSHGAARSGAEAFQVMCKESLNQFDPNVFAALEQSLGKFERIRTVFAEEESLVVG